MGMQFQPLNLPGSGLFGIKLIGAVSRSDKEHLLNLADKCLAKGKLQVILDVSELKNLGGGGAAAFAEFQSRLVDAGGEAVFVGAQEVVRKFLQGKFDDLPLRFFPDLEEALAGYGLVEAAPEVDDPELESKAAPADEDSDEISWLTSFCDEVPEPKPLETSEETSRDEADTVEDLVAEVGAVGFFAEEFEFDEEDDEEAGDDPDDPAVETDSPDNSGTGAATKSGRRRDHSYTSLSDAISALGGWSASGGDRNFGKALENLLFSHGLAESATLLALHDGYFQDADGRLRIPADGSLIRQLTERGQPLIMLDILDDELDEQETSLLEEITPDIMLPVKAEGGLGAVLLMKRADGNEEYSVVEHFALELLMRVLSGEETGQAPASSAPARKSDADEASDPDEEAEPVRESWQEAADNDETVAEVLLRLALDLPDADDRPHFWRIFARNLWPVLPIRTLAFLKEDKRRAQVVVGDSDALAKVNLGLNRLKVYFKTMERPVATGNLPDFFREVRSELLEAEVDWLAALRWEDQYLGTVLMTLDPAFDSLDAETGDLIHDLFAETSRMLARFDDSHENADVNLEVVTMIMGMREKRMFGSDELTRSMVTHLRRLARAMGFPPDQERDLIYGCLLRDIGLMDKEDALMGSPDHLDPIQWSLYKRHPEEGARMLEQLPLSPSIIEVVRYHHERFSGEGFPQGLEGRQIPLTARVVTVVENYVSMVVGTDTREPVLPMDAARILRDNLGLRYDPDIVHLFLRAVLPEAERSPVEL